MNDAIETFEVAGRTVEIYTDTDPESPRKWDNLGVMVCFNNRHGLGDDHDLKAGDFNGWDGIEEYLREERDAAVILPLYLYDHSGITIRTGPFSCGWDSGQVGFIYATHKAIAEAGIPEPFLGGKTPEERAKEILEQEVKTYDEYLTGEVYGYLIRTPDSDPDGDDEDFDSCWGFFGLDYCKQEATEAATHMAWRKAEEQDTAYVWGE